MQIYLLSVHAVVDEAHMLNPPAVARRSMAHSNERNPSKANFFSYLFNTCLRRHHRLVVWKAQAGGLECEVSSPQNKIAIGQ